MKIQLMMSRCEQTFNRFRYYVEDIALLSLRLYAAQVIFKFGWLKMSQWEVTVMIFSEGRYADFFEDAWLAAVSTGVEIIFPVMIFFGFFARPSALLLILHNFLLIMFVPIYQEDGFYNQMVINLIMLMVVLYGPGKISLQYHLTRKLDSNTQVIQ